MHCYSTYSWQMLARELKPNRTSVIFFWPSCTKYTLMHSHIWYKEEEYAFVINKNVLFCTSVMESNSVYSSTAQFWGTCILIEYKYLKTPTKLILLLYSSIFLYFIKKSHTFYSISFTLQLQLFTTLPIKILHLKHKKNVCLTFSLLKINPVVWNIVVSWLLIKVVCSWGPLSSSRCL